MTLFEQILIILGLTEVAKQYGLPSKFAPVFSILLAMALEYTQLPTSEGVVRGFLMGGTLAGLYQLIKRIGRRMFYISKAQPTTSHQNLEPDQDRMHF